MVLSANWGFRTALFLYVHPDGLSKGSKVAIQELS